MTVLTGALWENDAYFGVAGRSGNRSDSSDPEDRVLPGETEPECEKLAYRQSKETMVCSDRNSAESIYVPEIHR